MGGKAGLQRTSSAGGFAVHGRSKQAKRAAHLGAWVADCACAMPLLLGMNMHAYIHAPPRTCPLHARPTAHSPRPCTRRAGARPPSPRSSALLGGRGAAGRAASAARPPRAWRSGRGCPGSPPRCGAGTWQRRAGQAGVRVVAVTATNAFAHVTCCCAEHAGAAGSCVRNSKSSYLPGVEAPALQPSAWLRSGSYLSDRWLLLILQKGAHLPMCPI